MVQRSIRYAAYALIAAGACGVSATASAAGCNGVVDQFKWGCAAWDNNNGPQYPNYKPPKQASQPAQPKTTVKAAPAHQAQQPKIAPNASAGIISRDGAGLIGQDGSTLVGNDGASLRR